MVDSENGVVRRFVPIVGGLLAAGLVLARQIGCGPGLDYDSLQYVSVARSLLEGEGFVNAKGNLQMLWPPLYPLVLAAAGGVAGLDPLEVAGPLNALFFGLTVFVAGRYLMRRTASPWPAAWGCAALALSIPLADVSSWILSEALFMSAAVAALISIDGFLSGGRTRSLIAAAAWGAAAWQARYIGVATPLFAGLALLFFRRGRRRVWEAAAVWLSAGAAMAPWMLRNYLLGGALTGDRGGAGVPLGRVMRGVAEGFAGWAHFELPAAAAAVALGAAAWGALRAGAGGGRRAAESGDGGARRAAVALWLGFALTYGLLLVAAMASGNAFSRVWPRYVTPLHIPLIMAAALALDGLFRRLPRRGARGATRVALAAALGLWTAGQVLPNARHIARKNAGEIGEAAYNTPRWTGSETLAYIRENPMAGAVYGNGLLLLAAFHNAGRAEYFNLPADDAVGRESMEARLAAAPPGAWVVWLKGIGRDDAGGEARLRALPGTEVEAELEDGFIFRRDGAALRAAGVGD